MVIIMKKNNLHITLTELRNESRLLKEVDSLSGSGVMARIYIAALHGDGLKVIDEYTDKMSVHRFALKTRRMKKNLLMQLVKYIEFSFRIFYFYRKCSINCINIHGLALLPLGVCLKRLWNARLVYDAHELETEKSGLVGLRKKLSKWLEANLIKHVDLTIVVSESIADWYAREYDIERPVVVLNVPKKRQLSRNNHFRLNLSIRDDQKIILYQGGLMMGRGIDLMLKAMTERIDKRVVAVFMGYGPLEKKIKNITKKYDHIFYYPAVSPEKILEYSASADIGISLIENTCLSYYYCLPNKLFEYAMVGLPVAVSNMKDMAEIVKENNIGAVIDDLTPEGINRMIDDLLDMDLMVLGQNAYLMACRMSWEIQERKMLDAYAGIGFVQAANCAPV